MFILLLLTGILFSMYSCQYEVVPIGTIVPVGASSIQNNWMNMREGLYSFLPFLYPIFNETKEVYIMFNINELIENLNKATKIT